MSNALVTCTFTGTVSSVRVQGQGQIVLVEPSVFNGARVRLEGAEIEGQTKIELDLSTVGLKYFDPIGLSESPCDEYDATYRVTGDKKYIVDIVKGGSHGGLQGVVPGISQTCANGCQIVWGSARKYVEISKSGGPFDLTGPFLGDAEETCHDSMTGRKGAPRPSTIELDGASGTIDCNGATEHWTGHRTFIDSGRGVLDLRVIRIENGSLHVDMTYEPPPNQTMTLIVGGGIAFVLVAGCVWAIWWFRRLRQRKMQQQSVVVAQTSEVTPEMSKRITKALIDAFPSETKLAQLLSHSALDKKLANIAGERRPLPDMIFDVVERARTDKWILDLVREAHAANSGNAELRAIVQELGIGQSTDSAA